VNRYKWQIVAVGVLGLNLALWLTHCSKPTVDPSAVVLVDSGASVAVDVSAAVTLSDAVSAAVDVTP
jgi:hypothetical protein